MKANIPTWIQALGATGLLAASAVAQAQIAPYSDDFEGYGVAGVPNGGVTDFSPWFGFSDNGGFPGGYTFSPSINGPQITALGYNGSDNQYMNFYANYDNANVHDRVNCSPCSPNLQEVISVFIQQSFTGADTASGDTWMFQFNYRQADVPPGGNTQTAAFIRVFDPIFNVLYEATLDTDVSSEWRTGVLTVELDPAWLNGNVQIGFTNTVGNYDDSGIFYDDVVWQPAIPAVVDAKPGFSDRIHAHHDGRLGAQGIANLPDDEWPVVVYGASTAVGDPVDLNTNQIDFNTVRFGPGNAAALSSPPAQYGIDDDSDGQDDASFTFRMSEMNFQCGEQEATFVGELTTGDAFVGTDTFGSNCQAQCHN